MQTIKKADEPLLSVVIIGLNEAGNIRQCIDKIKIAVEPFSNTEIVYVDSCSSDNTISIASSKSVRVIQLSKTHPPSPSAGRYVGSLVTNSKFIMFVDADTMVTCGWIKPAIDLMVQDSSIAMFSGMYCTDRSTVLGEGEDLGVIKPIYKLSGSWAPIVSRETLEKAGNWNPFIRCREEEDLAIRMKHYVPGSKILRCERLTVYTPKCPAYQFSEFLRRAKIGFIKGPGISLRNAIKYGYLMRSLNMAKQMLLTLLFIFGLVCASIFGFWWQFLLGFFGIVLIRAIITWNFARFTGIYCSFLIGLCCLWEFLTVSAKTSSDYSQDFNEMGNSD